ncbi:MAG: hypothetical protein WC783_05370 [Candidatus Paceibacterota bacterium]|jgi:galactose mutarotase-like enzyme
MLGNPSPIEAPRVLKIETVRTPDGGEVSYCPERGGIITSIKLHGKEILYLDEATLRDTSVNVKGGVPVLFPNAGPIPDELKTPELANLEQHGFARKQKWQPLMTIDGFIVSLEANDETKKVFPYDFDLSIIGKLERDGSFTISQQAENFEIGKDMPVSFGLHPYFRVPSGLKKDIRFNFEGGKVIEENIEQWENGKPIKAVSIANPGGPFEVSIPELGTLVFTISPEYKRVWIWSQTGKDFICVEPVMRDAGGIVKDPEMLKIHQKYSASMNVQLKTE